MCSEKVKILTGMKQGDPMSPLLFNLSTDLLLCQLGEGKEGFKYKNSSVQVKELTRAGEVEFLGFPIGTRGKWYKAIDGFLADLGLSSSHQMRLARLFSQRALLASVDILHIFTSKGKDAYFYNWQIPMYVTLLTQSPPL